ncbi:MAG: PIN domain-containing protein [Gemmatimonas sp.]|nr:PIN domain-containing protein [Gemmatimonas sp.]
MTALVIDASVWVSAADATDHLSGPSRDFLAVVTAQALPLALPDFAALEVACALARRLRDGERGRALADQMARSPMLTIHSSNPSLLRQAIETGTRDLLRAGDSLYAAFAEQVGGTLVSWDRELIERSGAVTPPEWLDRNTREAPEDSRETENTPDALR